MFNVAMHGLHMQVWDNLYFPDDINCKMCEYTLSSSTKLSGSRGQAWLLTKCGLQPIEVRVKTCQNSKCQARHGFSKWKSGIVMIVIVTAGNG